jgi:hypothetical protein
MKLVCAWCGVAIDRPGYRETVDPNTSHGMCPACAEVLCSQERGVTLHQHLSTIPIPILLIDDSNAVVGMNAKACDTLGKELEGTETPFFGEVFDCLHSGHPEGCGRSIHCSGCAIRRSVARTFETGEPQILIPATLSIEKPDQVSNAVFSITTMKRDGLVLLRVASLDHE